MRTDSEVGGGDSPANFFKVSRSLPLDVFSAHFGKYIDPKANKIIILIYVE